MIYALELKIESVDQYIDIYEKRQCRAVRPCLATFVLIWATFWAKV